MIEKVLTHMNTFSSGWRLHHRDPAGSFIFACVQQQCIWLTPNCVDVVGCSEVLMPASYVRSAKAMSEQCCNGGPLTCDQDTLFMLY